MDTDTSSKAYRNEGLLIGVIIFLLVFFFLVVIFLAIAATDATDGGLPSVDVETGAFLSPCNTTPCQTNLECDGNTFTCKLPEGEVCTDASDCVTSLICSGRCASGATGSLNQLCPCDPGFRCELDTDGFTRCKGVSGAFCTADSDCVSLICLDNGTCAAGAPDAFPCLNDDTCSSKNCSLGFCQPEGVTTGVLGASCASSDVNFCGATGLTGGRTGASCNSTVSIPLTCSCVDGPGEIGVCIGASQGITSSCNIPASGCAPFLICLNGTGMECVGDESCVCSAPYENPNEPIEENSCIGGMSKVNNQGPCYNLSGLGCTQGSSCVSGVCNNPSVMAVYRFDQQLDPALYAGSVTLEIDAEFDGPSGPLDLYKMFSTSSGSVDTIYVVDHMQGFLQTIYDTAGTMTPAWTTLIPLVTTGPGFSRTLIDVGYNGQTFLVAFNETTNSGQNDTVYTWDPNTNTFTPFNFIPGSGITGTQYTNNQPLSIDYIDISPGNDAEPAGGDVLIVEDSTVYVKSTTVTQYSIGVIAGGERNGHHMENVGGLTRYYFDLIQQTGSSQPPGCPENGTEQQVSRPIQCPSFNNIAFIGSYTFPDGCREFNDLLQFSGNIASITLPLDPFRTNSPCNGVEYQVYDFSIYSPGSTGMDASAIIMLANANRINPSQLLGSVVAVSYAGNTAILPYQVGLADRSLATANAFYILSPNSCN